MSESAMARIPLVCVVDDDESVRESLPPLLGTEGYGVAAYASAEDFLASTSLARADCLILDVRMPGMTGPELQRELAVRRLEIPIVFVTAHDDEDILPQLIGRGAVACLRKPFSEETLLGAVEDALRPR